MAFDRLIGRFDGRGRCPQRHMCGFPAQCRLQSDSFRRYSQAIVCGHARTKKASVRRCCDLLMLAEQLPACSCLPGAATMLIRSVCSWKTSKTSHCVTIRLRWFGVLTRVSAAWLLPSSASKAGYA